MHGSEASRRGVASLNHLLQLSLSLKSVLCVEDFLS